MVSTTSEQILVPLSGGDLPISLPTGLGYCCFWDQGKELRRASTVEEGTEMVLRILGFYVDPVG